MAFQIVSKPNTVPVISLTPGVLFRYCGTDYIKVGCNFGSITTAMGDEVNRKSLAVRSDGNLCHFGDGDVFVEVTGSIKGD